MGLRLDFFANGYKDFAPTKLVMNKMKNIRQPKPNTNLRAYVALSFICKHISKLQIFSIALRDLTVFRHSFNTEEMIFLFWYGSKMTVE